jgi:hypothetical protein
MNMNARALVWLLLGLTVPVAEAGILSDLLNFFFGPILNAAVQSVCSGLTDQFADSLDLTCACRGFFSGGDGIKGELSCTSGDNYCLINDDPLDQYCGKAEVTAEFSLRERGVTGIDGCFAVKTNLPEGVQVGAGGSLAICANVVPVDGEDFKFKSCAIDWAGKKCTSCTVCDNQRDFKFDCSNINVGTAVKGPVLAECEGFGFLDDL